MLFPHLDVGKRCCRRPVCRFITPDSKMCVVTSSDGPVSHLLFTSIHNLKSESGDFSWRSWSGENKKQMGLWESLRLRTTLCCSSWSSSGSGRPQKRVWSRLLLGWRVHSFFCRRKITYGKSFSIIKFKKRALWLFYKLYLTVIFIFLVIFNSPSITDHMVL